MELMCVFNNFIKKKIIVKRICNFRVGKWNSEVWKTTYVKKKIIIKKRHFNDSWLILSTYVAQWW